MLFFYFVYVGTLYFLLQLPLVDGSTHEMLFVIYSLVVCAISIKDKTRFLQNTVVIQLLLLLGEIIFYSTIYYLDSDFSVLELLAYAFLILPFVLIFPKTVQQWRGAK